MKDWKISDYISFVSANRQRLQQVFFGLALISLIFNFCFGISIAQIGANPLLNQDVDPVYLLLMSLGVPQFISGPIAPWFDALLFLSCIASIIWTRYTIFPILFCILHYLYFITYNMLSGHHYINVGIVVMSLSFIFSNQRRFAFAFSACRFVFCFMMFSAACWKIIRGNIWHTDQTNMLLITTHLEMLVINKSSIVITILKWLIGHKQAAHLIWIVLILIEGLFIIGFINYKWDRILFIAYLLFFFGGWLIFNIYNYENLLFLLTLKPVLLFLRSPYLKTHH